MNHFIKIVHSFSRWICWVSLLALIGMMLLTSSDVVLRYIGYPIKGTFDIVGLLGTVVVALPIAYTQILGRHIATEFMASRGNPLVQTIIMSMKCLFSIGMYAMIAWQCSLLGTKLWRIGRVSDTIEIPIFPLVYVVAFGCALNCFVLFIDLFNVLTKFGTKKNAGDSQKVSSP
jgi:TRAP-type C4-dicarboxylate transport system permease small subunit